MWGLRRQIDPLIVDGRQTLAVAREGVEILVVVAVALFAVQLAILAVVLRDR